MNKILTIAIPTYNRTEYLIKNIPYLLDQMTVQCELIIIDNCSEEIVENKIEKIKKEYSNVEFNIIRNSKNIGLFGNILKCFEECKTKWLYIMGDDDRILPNSISLMLNDIGSNSNCLNISYQWNPEENWSSNRPKMTYGMKDYLQSIEAIHHVMFLSSNIYNVDVLSEFLHTGHYFQLTSAPHIVLLIMALDNNEKSKVYLSNNYLVDNFNSEVEEDKKWDRLDFFRNIKLLLDLPLKKGSSKQLFLLYKKSYSIKKYLWVFLNIKLNKETTDRLDEFKKSIYYYKIYSSFKDRVLIFLCKILLLMPKTSLLIINFFKKSIIKINKSNN